MTQPEECAALFALVRAAWGKPTNYNFKDLGRDEWQTLFRLSCDNNIRAIAAEGIKKTGLEVPRSVWLPWLAEAAKVQQQYNQSRNALAELTALFCQNGIPTLELKGGTLAALYPVPWQREATDLDLYHYGQHRQADRLLRDKLGITPIDDGRHHIKYAFGGVTVESHYAFLNNSRRSNHKFEALLQQHVPSPTFQALFLMRHTAAHFAAGRVGIRHLLDWAALAPTPGIDWQLVAQTFNHFGMSRFAAVWQAILQRNLGFAPQPALPISSNNELTARVAHEVVYGEFAERHHDREDLSRVLWKLRRHHASGWKRRLVGNSGLDTLASVLHHLSHLHTIIHKS